MSNQYFENNQNLEHNYQTINYYFKGQKLEFTTDNGVFCKGYVDFGSSLLLKNINITTQKTLLDVGCGYGTIGITLAKIYPNLNVTMVDVNKRALELTKENALKNAINNYNILESFAYQNINNKYDLIVSNPPIRAGKKVVFEILENSINYLNDKGTFICVIQKKQGAPSAKKCLENVYNNCQIIDKDNGYYILMSIKE